MANAIKIFLADINSKSSQVFRFIYWILACYNMWLSICARQSDYPSHAIFSFLIQGLEVVTDCERQMWVPKIWFQRCGSRKFGSKTIWVQKMQAQSIRDQQNVGQQKIKVQKSWVNKIVGPEDMGLGDMGQNVSPKKLGKKNYLVHQKYG